MPRALPVVGRTLLRLGRCRADGVLSLRARDHHAQLLFRDGVIVGFGERRRSDRPASTLNPRELSWLLRRRVVRDCARIAASELTRAEFRADSTLAGTVSIDEPLSAIDFVVQVARQLPLGSGAARALRSEWDLSEVGKELANAALGPHEAALLGALQRMKRADGESLVGIAGGHQALKFLCAWQEMGLVQSHRQGGRHQLLLAQTRALRSGRLSVETQGESQRALRRRAAALHPDRYEEGLGCASREVMEALLAASGR